MDMMMREVEGMLMLSKINEQKALRDSLPDKRPGFLERVIAKMSNPPVARWKYRLGAWRYWVDWDWDLFAAAAILFIAGAGFLWVGNLILEGLV